MAMQAGTLTPWEPMPAPFAAGSILMGSHYSGAHAVIPPGVLILAPEDSDPSYSREGWRHAIWRTGEAPHAALLKYRPSEVKPITLSRAVRITRIGDANCSDWVKGQVQSRARALTARLKYAEGDDMAAWRLELNELLLDATNEFSGDWVRAMLARVHPKD